MLSGTSLKTGAGELARITIRPFIFASVFPIKVRMPFVRLKSPRIAMIGIVSPRTASIVRVGRVIRFCQANRHMKRPCVENRPSPRVRSSSSHGTKLDVDRQCFP